MNHSIYTADRATHLKIVVVALLAATALCGLSIFLHSTSNVAHAMSSALVKAGKPVAMSSSTTILFR